MSSSVDISNQALLMLGAQPIVSFDDQTVEANALQVLYEPAKAQVLRSYPWRCATKNATLAQLAGDPIPPEWSYAFALPDDSLRILGVYSLDQVRSEAAWTLEGRSILTRQANVAARYVYDIEEPLLDGHVEMALAAKLALDLSYTLTGSNNRETAMYQLYDQKLNEARVTDRQEASHRKFRIEQLDTVRR